MAPCPIYITCSGPIRVTESCLSGERIQEMNMAVYSTFGNAVVVGFSESEAEFDQSTSLDVKISRVDTCTQHIRARIRSGDAVVPRMHYKARGGIGVGATNRNNSKGPNLAGDTRESRISMSPKLLSLQ